MWDPSQYLKFERERARPFHDLLAAVDAVEPRVVVDLGCGPGNLTAMLAQRWPSATVVGVDSSPDMIARATDLGARVRFVVGDLREWRAEQPVDLLVSNATLQWVPGHTSLFERFVGSLAPGGCFAFQVPGNFDAPVHRLLREVCALPRWRDRIGVDMRRELAVAEPADYLRALRALGCDTDVWETTYMHVLPADGVLEWAKGTALRPVLSMLDETDQPAFLDDYGAALREAYTSEDDGTTVLPFRRIFGVARR